MRGYYESHGLPSPARVLIQIDATRGVVKLGGGLMARLFGSSIAFSDEDLKAVRSALRALQTVLETRAVETDEERIRIRLQLSAAEELVRQKLGRHAAQVEKVEHLNETPGLGLRPLSELVGVGWPESD